MRNIYMIPDLLRLAESCALSEEFGASFEYNDFYAPEILDCEEQFEKRIALYKSLDRDRSADTLHGAFLDVTVHSEDSMIRHASKHRVRQSMEAARKLGIRGVVFHTGTIPNFKGTYYHDNWVDKNTVFWTDICREYAPIEVYMENMFDMNADFLADLCRNMQNIANFGICLDYAHARIFGGSPNEWIDSLAPYIRHMHINDTDGNEDLHAPVGDGVIDWNIYNAVIRQREIEPSVLVEMKSLKRQRQSLCYMQKHQLYPF